MPYLGGNLGSSFIQQSNDFMALGFPVFFHSQSLRVTLSEGNQFQAMWPKPVTN